MNVPYFKTPQTVKEERQRELITNWIQRQDTPKNCESCTDLFHWVDSHRFWTQYNCPTGGYYCVETWASLKGEILVETQHMSTAQKKLPTCSTRHTAAPVHAALIQIVKRVQCIWWTRHLISLTLMSSAVSDSMHKSQRRTERIRAFKCKLGQSFSTVPSRYATLETSPVKERAITHTQRGNTCCSLSSITKYTHMQTQIHTPALASPVTSSPVRSVQIRSLCAGRVRSLVSPPTQPGADSSLL